MKRIILGVLVSSLAFTFLSCNNKEETIENKMDRKEKVEEILVKEKAEENEGKEKTSEAEKIKENPAKEKAPVAEKVEEVVVNSTVTYEEVLKEIDRRKKGIGENTELLKYNSFYALDKAISRVLNKTLFLDLNKEFTNIKIDISVDSEGFFKVNKNTLRANKDLDINKTNINSVVNIIEGIKDKRILDLKNTSIVIYVSGYAYSEAYVDIYIKGTEPAFKDFDTIEKEKEEAIKSSRYYGDSRLKFLYRDIDGIEFYEFTEGDYTEKVFSSPKHFGLSDEELGKLYNEYYPNGHSSWSSLSFEMQEAFRRWNSED